MFYYFGSKNTYTGNGPLVLLYLPRTLPIQTTYVSTNIILPLVGQVPVHVWFAPVYQPFGALLTLLLPVRAQHVKRTLNTHHRQIGKQRKLARRQIILNFKELLDLLVTSIYCHDAVLWVNTGTNCF